MNVESELKDIINRLYDIQDVSGPDLSKKIYEIILQCREAIGYRKAELDRVQSSRKPIKSGYDNEIYRQAFGALLEDYAPEGDFPGGYRVLVDGNYETEFSANSREEAIQKFKDYFANKKKGVNSSRQIKSSRENINGYDCLVVDGDYVDDHDLYFVDYVIDNDVVEWSLFRDDEDTYYAVKGEY